MNIVQFNTPSVQIPCKHSITSQTVKPFLRWAGGKTWLVKHLHLFLPENGFKKYHEPFLGGGAIFFSLNNLNKAFLSDSNADLITTYQVLKSNIEGVIKVLKGFKNNERFYYKVRGSDCVSPIEGAARFIFLNQTSFNGIYRVNQKGQYNVPFGYRTKGFLDEENLRLVSNKLQNATLFSSDFDNIKKNIKNRDLVFLDPPYTVTHNMNGFIKYNQKLFSLEDQYRLSKLIDHIRSHDAFYIVTNASHPKIIEIFEKGDKRIELPRASLIGGKNSYRGRTIEYIFTNCLQ